MKNENFIFLIQRAQNIASTASINWNIQLDASGVAVKGQEWHLRKLTKDGGTGKELLRTFSQLEEAQEQLVVKGLLDANAVGKRPVSEAWQDLIKAHTLDHLIVKKKSITFAQSAALAWRFLATVAQVEPWLVTSDDVRLACEISDLCENTTSRSINIMALMRNFVDVLHLFNACPISPLVNRSPISGVRRAKFAKAEKDLSKTLAERKSHEKLPERRAFWQLMSIVFTDYPASFIDCLRFAMVKLLTLTGLRIGEVVQIPLDWRRTRNYVDERGKPAGESGGISEALLIRHFAKKQREPYLYEETQFVPDAYRKDVEEIFDEVVKLTAPLRATLRAQYETGRTFPQYKSDQLVDALEMYVHLTGNPVWVTEPFPQAVQESLDRYRKTFNPVELSRLSEYQKHSTYLAPAVSRFYSKEQRDKGLVLRDADGHPTKGKGVRGKFLLVSDVETFVSEHVPTKRSDLAPQPLNSGGELAPWEMLFLMPKRAVGEGRGQTVLDPSKTFSVGIADQHLLQAAIGDIEGEKYTLFSTYGLTKEERTLTLKSYTLRHLQTTELFRLGVADTLISKRYNRRSVAQSYVYDHRSLAEELDAIELPDEWVQVLGESKAATVAKMILVGRANGPIVRQFKRIQKEEGDDAALRFLSAEADGFHATPYGTCLNSFTVDPCPKHLECLNDCRHLSATNLTEHHENAVTLHGRLKIALEHARAKPDGTIGKLNQINHALKRLEGVEKLLATAPGELVFPGGIDRSAPTGNRSVLDDA